MLVSRSDVQLSRLVRDRLQGFHRVAHQIGQQLLQLDLVGGAWHFEQDARDLGVLRLFAKPFDTEELLATLAAQFVSN